MHVDVGHMRHMQTIVSVRTSVAERHHGSVELKPAHRWPAQLCLVAMWLMATRRPFDRGYVPQDQWFIDRLREEGLLWAASRLERQSASVDTTVRYDITVFGLLTFRKGNLYTPLASFGPEAAWFSKVLRVGTGRCQLERRRRLGSTGGCFAVHTHAWGQWPS